MICISQHDIFALKKNNNKTRLKLTELQILNLIIFTKRFSKELTKNVKLQVCLVLNNEAFVMRNIH